MNHVTLGLAGRGATWSYPGKCHCLLIGSGYDHVAHDSETSSDGVLGVLGLQDRVYLS